MALCSSESNFSISRGRRNCREKHCNSAHPLHHLAHGPARLQVQPLPGEQRWRGTCNRQPLPRVRVSTLPMTSPSRRQGCPSASSWSLLFLSQSHSRNCSSMNSSLWSGNSEVLKNPQGALYLSKLGCRSQYSPEAQDQVFPLDAMRIIGGLERKQGAGDAPARKHPNPAISQGCITSSPARQQQCQPLQLAWHQPVSLGTTAHS